MAIVVSISNEEKDKELNLNLHRKMEKASFKSAFIVALFVLAHCKSTHLLPLPPPPLVSRSLSYFR